MKIIYLLPPSEGKNTGGELLGDSGSSYFLMPFKIAINATQKDLKCIGKRYEEGINLNKNINQSDKLEAISRYSGVMYNAIDYRGMNTKGKKYFENNFRILSGMYGILHPLDMIGNYKLPIETKGLYTFWGEVITKYLREQDAEYIVDLLPGSYAKMIDWKQLNTNIIRMNFLHKKNGIIKKISHGVKSVKGKYIHDLCESELGDIEQFEGEKVQISENEYYINIIT